MSALCSCRVSFACKLESQLCPHIKRCRMPCQWALTFCVSESSPRFTCSGHIASPSYALLTPSSVCCSNALRFSDGELGASVTPRAGIHGTTRAEQLAQTLEARGVYSPKLARLIVVSKMAEAQWQAPSGRTEHISERCSALGQRSLTSPPPRIGASSHASWRRADALRVNRHIF